MKYFCSIVLTKHIFIMPMSFLVIHQLQFFSETIFVRNQMVRNLLSEYKDCITEDYENNGKFYSKLVWRKETYSDKYVPFAVTENPDTILRTRPFLDVVILKNFYCKNNKGKRINFNELTSGKIYTCLMWLTHKNFLKDRGNRRILYQN